MCVLYVRRVNRRNTVSPQIKDKCVILQSLYSVAAYICRYLIYIYIDIG